MTRAVTLMREVPVPRLDLLDRATAPDPEGLDVIPPLENGDYLTRAEYERRYDAMPEGVRAELIDGIVYMASPVSYRHSGPHSSLTMWLGDYARATRGTHMRIAPSVRLGPKDMPEPDTLLRIVEEAGGLSRVDEDDYLSGPVELAAEVAASSASRDLNQKKRRYLERGIVEYLVVVVRTREVLWFVRRGGRFVAMKPDRRGVLRSKVFPGLWLDAPALLAGDDRRVHAVLAKGLRSREHAAFARKLRRRIGAS